MFTGSERQDAAAVTEEGEGSLRLIPLMYAGLQLGFVSVSKQKGILLKQLRAKYNAQEKQSMREQQASTAALRAKCFNNLHLATARSSG